MKLRHTAFSSLSPLATRPSSLSFTLLELLIVVAIITLLTTLLAPAFTQLKSSGDVTNAAYAIAELMDQGRAYAMARNTYVWVGFYEESASISYTSPATAGVGRIVLSVVGSRDGTVIYNPNSPGGIDPTRLTQLGKLTKIDNIHLATFTDGSGSGSTFDTRPPVFYPTARIGDTSPPNPSLAPFQYPVGSPPPTAQYTFVKAVQFSPRGEALIDNNNYTLKSVAEIGLQPAHGSIADRASRNVVAIQFSGIAGNFKIYRR